MVTLDECMLSSPLAAGQEWYLIIRQMHSVLAELLPSPTEFFVTKSLAQTEVKEWCGRGTPKISPWSRGRTGCSWKLHQYSIFPN